MFFRDGSYSLRSAEAFSGAKIQKKSNEHCRQRGEGFCRLRAQKINHHPNRNSREHNRWERVSPDAVRTRQSRLSGAEDDDSNDRKQRTEQQTELNINKNKL